MSTEVLYAKEGEVAVLTLNRPEKRNALSLATCRQLHDAWTRFEADEQSKVAILTGAGDNAFCAGWDISEKRSGVELTEADMAPRVQTRSYVTKPVIAAVNGAALAAGMALVEACDLVLAADSAWFALPEAKLGLHTAPFVQSLWTLPQRILMEMLLTGERLGAQRAYELGFVNRVVPLRDLMGEALCLAHVIARSAPLVVKVNKEMIYKGIEAMGMPEAHRIAQALSGPLSRSEDATEGFRARAEGRAPRWKGR